MNNIFNKYKITFTIYFLFFVIIFVSLQTAVGFTVVAPAYNDDIDDFIVVPSSYEAEGSFHTTSVISLDSMSLFQLLLSRAVLSVDVTKQPEYFDDINESDLRVMDVLYKDDSLQTSLIVGIEKAGMEIDYTTYWAVYLTYRHMSPDGLKVGDYILKVNDNEDIFEALGETACNETTYFEIIRDGKIQTVQAARKSIYDDCTYGIVLRPFSEINSTEVGYRLIDTDTGGPSGGLMQSLFVYNALTETDYTHGLKIGGTGTIDTEGNVGYIGGVRQKIITAIGNDIDIFFVPYLEDSEDDNYIVAKKALEEFDSDMILVGVSTFDEAIEYLIEYGDTNEWDN